MRSETLKVYIFAMGCLSSPLLIQVPVFSPYVSPLAAPGLRPPVICFTASRSPIPATCHPEKITSKSFNAGKSLGKSTSRICEYLMKVRPFVKELNQAFAPYLGGEDPSV